MTDEQQDSAPVPAPALEAEAARLAAAGRGDPHHVYDGLAAFAHRHGHGSGAPPDALRLPANRAVIRYRATRYCKVGYRRHHYWLDTLEREVAQLPPPVPDAEEVGEIFLAAWRDRVDEQAQWPEVTDHTRLQRAFAALNRSGIVAAEDFTCCQRCAGQEIYELIPDDSTPDGFVFFHQQDTPDMVDGGTLRLGFGGFVPRDGDTGPGPRVRHAPTGDPSHLAVAERTVAALQAEGLTTDWNGTTGQRVGVVLPDWHARIAPYRGAY